MGDTGRSVEVAERNEQEQRKQRRAEPTMADRIERAKGVPGGVVGDARASVTVSHATPMSLVHEGKTLSLDAEALRTAYPRATDHAVLLVHGAKSTETVWRPSQGADYGALLARDCRLTPLYLRYDASRSIPENGVALSRLLETLSKAYPVSLEGLVLVGHGLGGLVLRSATREATSTRASWLRRVRRAIYLGLPQRGALLERLAALVGDALEETENTQARVKARVASLSEDGLQLGPASPGVGQSNASRAERLLLDVRHPVPLLPTIQHFLVATALPKEPDVAAYFGELSAPASSASSQVPSPAVRGAPAHAPAHTPVPGPMHALAPLHGHPHSRGALPPSHVRLLPKIAHAALTRSPEVYAVLREWCAE